MTGSEAPFRFDIADRMDILQTDQTETGASPSASATARHLFETMDWRSTELGDPGGWPGDLAGVARMVLAASLPMCVFAGPNARMIYNDAYVPVAGDRHPGSFGAPLLENGSEVAAFNRGMLEKVRAGTAFSARNRAFNVVRNGAPHTIHLDLHYSPVPNAAGDVVAVLAIVEETTSRVLAERALGRNEERLAFVAEGAGLVGHWDWDIDADLVTANASFARLYNVDIDEAARGVPITRFLHAVHPEDRERLGGAIDEALRARDEFRAQYRVVRPDGQIVWVLAIGRVIGGTQGKALRFPGICIDWTDQRLAADALAESEAKFRAIADTMPQMVWSTTADGLHDYYNTRWYEFTGVPVGSTDGEGWNGMFHPDDQERAWATWRHSLRTGDPYEIEYRLRHHSGEYRWTLGRALPIRDAAGGIIRWFGTCTDIHETKIASEEREIVAQELSHRIKNIFSVLGSIVSLTARARPEAHGFAEELRARILALGTAHEFVRPHSVASTRRDHASMHGLLKALLAAYDDQGGRVTISGANPTIDEGAATPLALIFHELGTNAAKYGGLAGDSGRVDITTAVEGDTCRVTWKETRTGGPVPRQPGTATSGFGSRLIELSIRGQMGGTIERRWEADGLRLDISFPVWALKRSGRLRR